MRNGKCLLHLPQMRRLLSRDPISRFGVAEKVFSCLLADQAGMLELKVRTLNLAAIDSKLLRKGARGRKDFP